VRIRDGKIIATEPDDTVNAGIAREDSRLSKDTIDKMMINTRPCARGFMKHNYVYDPNRVIYPMKRVGDRGEGKFERITWDEALDTIAKKMVEIKERYGPYSMTFVNGSGFQPLPIGSWFGAGVRGWVALQYRQVPSLSGW